MKDREMRGGLFWPALLIAAGVILLLNNMGQLDWTVWEIVFRLWPVLLIAWGLDLLIGRRSLLGGVVSLVLIAGVFAGSLALLGIVESSREPLSEIAAEPLDGVTSAEITLDPGIGELKVSSLVDSDQLFEASVPGPAERWMDYSTATSAGRASVQLGMSGSIVTPDLFGFNQDMLWDVAISDDVPVDLLVDMGVGRAELDLTDLQSENVTVDFGIGEIILRLPEEGWVVVDVDSGIGETTIMIPASMAARIEIDGGISGHTIPVKYEHDNGIYTSPDYAGADNRIDMVINQGIGQISIRHAGDH